MSPEVFKFLHEKSYIHCHFEIYTSIWSLGSPENLFHQSLYQMKTHVISNKRELQTLSLYS